MKKTLIVAAVIALAGMQMQTARAGEREWATAGKILTGVAIGAAIVSAVDAHASYSVTYSSGPAYCPPPARVVYAPAPVVCAPPPVVVVPAPVMCAPRPVVVCRPPVVCAPTVRVVYHQPHGHGYGHRWHR